VRAAGTLTRDDTGVNVFSTSTSPPPPPRRLESEILDDPAIGDAIRARSLSDVARSNVVFGGRRAVMLALAHLLPASGSTRPMTLLDVGTGTGDIPRAARKLAGARGVQLQTVGLDIAPSLASMARDAVDM